MHKILSFCLVLSGFLLLSSGCRDYIPTGDSTPSYSLSLQFKGVYNGEQVVKYKKYPFGVNNYPLSFNRFRTFLSDVYLMKGSEKVALAEVLDVDFFPDSAPSSLSIAPEYVVQIPEGNYTGIGFGIGVKSSLNSKLPTDFPVGHPLRNEIEYWPGWKSYIFSKLEATGDVNNDGTDDNWMQYHTGADPVYVEMQVIQPITVSSTSGKVTISFDIKKMLTQEDGNYYDLVANPFTSSSATDLVVSKYIANSFKRATTVQQ